MSEQEAAMTKEFKELYGGKYLTAADLKDSPRRRKVGKVAVEEFRDKDGSPKRKYVLYLEGEDKGVVLNKTNALRLAGAFGGDRAIWVGKLVELRAEMTGLGKEGVVVTPLRKAAASATDPDLNDAVPF
jgi:hypothetical protein